MRRDDVIEKELGEPKIERLPDLDSESPTTAKERVNEMLAETMMADTAAMEDVLIATLRPLNAFELPTSLLDGIVHLVVSLALARVVVAASEWLVLV